MNQVMLESFEKSMLPRSGNARAILIYLEPWRPVVDEAAMAAAGCNPGGGQGPF